MSNIGRTVQGYCGGVFGCRVNGHVEAEGVDWVVVRDQDHGAHFTTFESESSKAAYLKEWEKDPD